MRSGFRPGFLVFALAAILLTGCIGSENKRNPNIQRHEPKKRRILNTASVRSSKNIRKQEVDHVGKVVDSLPKNAWVSHDRDVYYHLGQDEASKVFRVYPWFKVPQKVKEESN